MTTESLNSARRTETGTRPLSWEASDPERRLAFPAGRFTRVNGWCSFTISLVLTLAFLGALFPFRESFLGQTFLQRGFIPYFIVFFSMWSLTILGLKSAKLRLQRRSLDLELVPAESDFVLSPRTVDLVLQRLYELVDHPRNFVLFNRIQIALSNLRNLGRVGDVDEILQTQAGNDESSMETSYSMLQGFVWAIPVLGFIGTVVGLSEAVGGFGKVLSSSNDLSQVKDALRSVTAGLAVAFETTMQGLVAALFIQLLLTWLKKSEEEFLDSCSEYCVRNVVSRLRLIPYEGANE